ncbi:sensor histidine kinase [Larkinella humicola]|uniref:Histidine kinase n=1 Tax=Larkinella humicola TaxID=2607654 RepID=A0A5N1JKS1_9BACT|nr:histidine kinase [Larkinella humicola]KAA9356468.1 histidine kinase [Larkinella humicola]
MNARFSFRQISGIASVIVAVLVNLPLIRLANQTQLAVIPGLPDTVFLVVRVLFQIAFTFFFIELNRYVLIRKRYEPWLNLAGWYGINFLLFLAINALFVALVLPWYPERPILVLVTTYFRGFFVWGTALLVANFLTVLQQNRSMQTENERLKRESLQAQLDGLRAQLNPHFLFNSLNALSSLIREGSANTQPYLSKLSQVLRYSLQVQNRSLVPFAEEMQFTMAYSFLLTMRFGANLQIYNELPVEVSWLIPTMSLQLLIENSVKHNVISNVKPLTIRLSIDLSGAFIRVSNSYQPKPEPADGTGMGLSNLENRYRLLTGKAIQIVRTEREFSVHLPIIPAV